MRSLARHEFEQEKTILIGSRAAEWHWKKDWWQVHRNNQNVPDADYFIRGVDKKYHGIHEMRVPVYAHGIPEEIFDSLKIDGKRTLSKDHLFTLKVSHATFDIHWNKTMNDIVWMKKQGCQLDEDLYKKLYAFWLITHKNHKSKVNLNKTNKQFFEDNVTRKYVHDDLHLAVAYFGRPLYDMIKKDPGLAKVSHEKFEKLICPHTQLQLCWEELYVTALERYYIPSEGKMNPLTAYKFGARKLVTSMTKGWFPHFIVMNWDELKEPEVDYVSLYKEAKAKDKLRLCGEWVDKHGWKY